ncbi:hypothetical protein GC176_22640 [bacterium]|nr:hypothetical protein [bacterium]
MAHSNSVSSRPGVAATQKRGAAYPKRTPFFFHRYTRWLIKTCAANLITADGCWLLATIAATEDSRRYRSAVSFYNAQLAAMCGWSVDKLDRVRRRCIDEGYLHYEPGGNRTPGLYWALVSDGLSDLADAGPIGELETDFSPQSAEHPADDSTTEPRTTCGENRDETADLSYLSPSRNPSPPLREHSETLISGTSHATGIEWQEVEGALVETGLADAAGTARAARDRGYSPGQVLELVAEFDRRRSEFASEGALAWRIVKSPPTRPVADGWPGQASTKPPVDEQSREADRLERLFGADLARLSPTRLKELAAQAGLKPADEIDRTVRSVRIPLLRQLARNASEAA